MQFGATFIADAQAPVAVQPGGGALDNPAPAPEAFTRFLPAPRNARRDATLAQQVAQAPPATHAAAAAHFRRQVFPVDSGLKDEQDPG